MQEAKKSIAVSVWKRYEAYDFEIAPSLAGACHEFKHETFVIRIQLPKKPHQKDWRNEDSPITCYRYRDRKYRKDPISYSVHSVDIVVDTGETRKIKKKALGIVNVSLFNASERNRLDKLAHKYDQLIESTFEYWINMLRWKSGIPTLCQFRHNRQKSTWGTRLLDSSSNKRFYAPPRVFVVQGRPIVSKKSWTLTQNALKQGINVPIWHLYISEANQKLKLGDTRGFVIDLAIATETLIRQVVNQLIASPPNVEFEKMVGNISIGKIVDKWFDLGFNNASWIRLKNDKGLIKHVIDIRNGIMHRGEYPTIERDRANQLAAAVLRFVSQGEKEVA